MGVFPHHKTTRQFSLIDSLSGREARGWREGRELWVRAEEGAARAMHGAGRAGDGCKVGMRLKVCASKGKRFLGKDARG